ncbi:MAG: serine hydrolase domain-containing protein [Sedimentitalea sp.]
MTSYKNSDPTPPIMAGSPVPPEWRVPRALWDAPPWNRWSFQHVRQLLPTVPVRAGAPSPLVANLQDINDLGFQALGGPTTIATMLDHTYTDGFIVLVDGKIITEQYFNGMRPETLHLAQSVSKSVVATVAGILIGRGLLNPALPITDVLPELAQTGWNGATLQHVLDMTSGTVFDEGYTSPDSDIAKTDVAAGWRPRPDDAADWPDCVWDQILGLKARDVDHGTRFQYRSIETDVLAHAMERATGQKLADLVSTELWQKIGAEHDACFTVDSAGYALADGGFNASLRDFARFAQVLLEGGRGIVPAEWITDIRRGPHGLFNDEGRTILPNGAYRNQFWIEDETRETFMCLGVFGQLIYVAPEYDMVAVKLSTWPDFVDADFKIDTLRGLHAIATALGKG